ncbi:signal transduction histidine kinase [Aquimarina sp. MAR_2010_214]|uniref:tetratricopeptide repeat-containing sensor histidine kinase n=1 Tax=Aquimarina sp. MAR_2010_214 TaxID=1250026 RepID=UPI000C70F550|nr:histidine kinase [Aquimarina sp. MAR_2010_214]PKV49205.1 signal transduction histidine kinase [Aquimarina sp. MAR_2010_214]
MYQYLVRGIFGIFILSSISLYSQENRELITFTSFGITPNTVDPELYQELKNSKNITTTLQLIEEISQIHKQSGNTDSIIYYGDLLKTEALAESISNQPLYLSKANYIIGWGKLKNGLYDEAMKHFLEGISNSPVSEMPIMHYKHQLGLGLVYLEQKKHDIAFPIFEACILESKNKETITLAKKFLGDIYFDRQNTEKASSYYLDVLENIPTQTPNKIRMETQINLGRIELFHDRTIKAMEYLVPVKEEAQENHFYDLYIDAVYHIGRVYYKLEQYDSAEMVLTSAYTNAVRWNRLELQRKVINMLKGLYASRGNYKNAYALMTQYVDVSNKIITKQNKKIVKELEIKYQTLQKEKEILSLKEEQLLKESELNRQRTIKKAFLIGFLAVLLPVVGLLFMYFQKLKTQIALNKSQEEVNTQKVYGLMKDQELNLIKATMEGQDKERQRLARELHDSVGGNLASIKLQLSNSDKTNDQEASIIKQVDETYNQVRDFSHNLIPKKFQKNPITSLIKEYINNVINGSGQQISFHPYPKNQVNQISPTLTEELFKIIQELLTNCLKHAKAKNIDIYLNHHDDSIQLLFEDDGVGFESGKAVDGIGFKNIKTRLNTLSGNMFIDSVIQRGTVINIEVPVA